MKFDKIEKLDDERFRRLTGVKRTTFDKMVQILQPTFRRLISIGL
jgi:hypothetical protein